MLQEIRKMHFEEVAFTYNVTKLKEDECRRFTIEMLHEWTDW
jgi:hypothetical protein